MLVPLHAAPHHAVAEIDALYDVYLDLIDKWGTNVSPTPRTAPGPRKRALGQPQLRQTGSNPGCLQDILFLGDFNADCSYVREQDWASIRLRSSEVFKWLIPDSADTTVGNSDCAYDRIVVCGAHLRRSLKPQSAAVHDFQEEFGLDQTQVNAEPGGAGGPRLPCAGRRKEPAPCCPGPGPASVNLALPSLHYFLGKAPRGFLAEWNKSGMVG